MEDEVLPVAIDGKEPLPEEERDEVVLPVEDVLLAVDLDPLDVLPLEEAVEGPGDGPYFRQLGHGLTPWPRTSFFRSPSPP